MDLMIQLKELSFYLEMMKVLYMQWYIYFPTTKILYIFIYVRICCKLYVVARSVCQQDKWMTKTRNGGSVELKLTLFHMPVSRHLKSCQLREAGYSSETTLLITGIPGMVNYDHLLFYIQCVGKLQLSEFQLTKPNSKGEAVLVLAKGMQSHV